MGANDIDEIEHLFDCLTWFDVSVETASVQVDPKQVLSSGCAKTVATLRALRKIDPC